TGAEIEQACGSGLVNQIGKDTLPELLALLSRARVLVSPDSGPVHMATMVGTPVVGLYAATNPARSGPYLSGRWCVDAYPEAARGFRGCEAGELPWNHNIEDRIRDKEAKQSFDRDFIELARAVYGCNDERAAIKKRINLQLGSRLIEEKSYKQYR